MKLLHDILTRLLPMLIVLGLVSCGNNDTPQPEDPNLDGQVVLTISVSNTADDSDSGQATSRDGSYDRGQGYENYIDIANSNFRFYFFDSDNRYIGPLAVDRVVPLESYSSSKQYVVFSQKLAQAMTQMVKVVALANWPQYPDDTLVPGVSTIDDVVTQQYQYTPAAGLPSADNLIPLYGVTGLMQLMYNSDHTANIGTIHLLRAFAKVEVEISAECSTSLEYVRLSRYNTRGYCAPAQVYSQNDYVHTDYDSNYTLTPTIPDGAEATGTIPFVQINEEGTRWMLYVPEYRNLERPDDQKSVILLKFRGLSQPDKLYFAYYDTDVSPNKPKTHFDILRNVWYKFTVGKKMPPLVQVVPYNEIDLRPLFGLFTKRDLVPIYDNDGIIMYYYDRDTGKYFGSDKITEIDDPYIVVDPITEWIIIRDLRDNKIGYYDPKTGYYYTVDYIRVPVLRIDDTTGLTIIRDSDGNTIAYYDPNTKKYYGPDKETELDIHPDDLRDVDEETGWYILYNFLGEIIGYYDPETDQYYNADKTPQV